MFYDKVFALGMVIGGVVGGYVGYKTGHTVGGFGPKRRLKKIKKVIGEQATAAREKVHQQAIKVTELLE